MTGAPGATPAQAEWYLARDGQQFGPLNDAELQKLVEFGHLKPTDLVWREGFAEWKTARILLPQVQDAEAAAPPAPSPVAAMPDPVPPAAHAAPQPAAQAYNPAQPNGVPDYSRPRHVAPGSHHAVMPQAVAVPHSAAAPQPVAAPVPAPASVAAPGGADPWAKWDAVVDQTEAANASHGAAVATNVDQAYPAQPAPTAYAQPAYQPPQRQPVPHQPASQPIYPPQQVAPPYQPPHQPAPAPQPAGRSGGYAPAPHPSAIDPRLAPPPRQMQPGAYQGHPHSGGHFDYQQPSPSQQVRTPVGAPPPEDEVYEDDDAPVQRRGALVWLKRVAVLLFFASTLSAAAWYAYPYRSRIASVASAVTSFGGGSAALNVSPIAGFSADPAETDKTLQKARLWQVLKREYPEWYAARLVEITEQSKANKPEAEIGEAMVKELVKLRRQFAADALSAKPPRLTAMAEAFGEALRTMRGLGTEQCFAFVSSGELSSGYAKALGQSQNTAALHNALVTIFEAAAEGRHTPRVYPMPRQADYDMLVVELGKRGWTNADLRLFSESQALAKAPPEKVCQLVSQWFESQLAVKDEDARLRLLVDALKPIVLG